MFGNIQIHRSMPLAGEWGGAAPFSAINTSCEWPAGRCRQGRRLVRYQLRDLAVHTHVVLFA